MTLRELIGEGAPEVEISGLAYDNRSVTPGTLFFCVPGFKVDGHDFAPDAVERGAAALVCERPLGLGVPEVVVDDVRAAMAEVAARFHGDPTRSLRVVGITGTNGKTTTAFLVRSILEQAGERTGLLGTVASIVGGVEEPVERTTPRRSTSRPRSRACSTPGDSACAMEVSSHALHLHRVDGIHFAARVFTNLTQDHLDFHPTMEDYFVAKRMLFERPGGPSIVNVDDEYGRRLAGEVPGALTFGIDHEADYRATGVSFDTAGSEFRCAAPDGSELPIQHAAARASSTCRTRWRRSRRPTRSASRSRTRLRRSRAPSACRAGSSRSTRARTSPCSWTTRTRRTRSRTCCARRARSRDGRLHVVFGAGGDRDQTKRPLMGRVASDLADRAIVTSDNPRSEDPGAIVDQVLAGTGGGAEREVDRRRAIALAVEGAAAGRRGRDRRQGARAGPGVRGRPQGAVRRRDGGARGAARCAGGAAMIDRDAAWVARRAGGLALRASAGGAAPAGP